jgi:hypothetical protein
MAIGVLWKLTQRMNLVCSLSLWMQVFTRTKADGTVTPLRRTRQSASGAAAPGMFEKRRASIMAPAVREGDGGELVYEAHVVAPLLGMRVEDVPNDPERQGEHLMRFVVAQDWHISVGAASAADKQEWIADITTAMAELQDTLQSPYILDATQALEATLRR